MAAGALGSVDEADRDAACAALRKALRDDRGEVRFAAAMSLAELKDAGAAAMLVDQLDDGDGRAREAAALALGSCRVINIKPGRVGGLSVARAIHDLCRARGVPVWCGGMLETGIGRAANVALKDAEVKKRFETVASEPIGGSPAQLEAMIKSDRALFEPRIKALGLKAQ